MIYRKLFFLLLVSGWIGTLLGQISESQLTLQQTGRVTDNTGKGIGGATIEIYDLIDMDNVPNQVELIGSISSSPDGSFSFKRIPPKPEVCCSLAVAIASGFGFHWTNYDADTKSIPAIELEQPPATITGQVVDSQNKPIAQAAVHAFIQYGDNRSRFTIGSTRFGMTMTNAEGWFAITDIPRDAGIEFCVEMKGYVPTYSFRTDDNLYSLQYKCGQDVRLTLFRPGSLECAVVHKDSREPIADVRVFAVRIQGPDNYMTYRSLHDGLGTQRGLYFNGDESASAKTDARGQLKIDGLKPGEYWVCTRPVIVSKQGWFYTREKVTVTEGPPASCMLYAVRPGTLRFQVVQGDKKPVENASVSFKHNPDDHYAMMLSGRTTAEGFGVTTRTDGYAEIRVAPGTYDIISLSKDTMSIRIHNPSVKVSSGQTETIVLTFDPKPGLGGTCIDPDGNPLAQTKVYFLYDPNHPVTTNEQGQFLFTHYSEGPVLKDSNPSIQSQLNRQRPKMFSDRFLVARHNQKRFVAIQHHPSGPQLSGPKELRLQPAYLIRGQVMNDQNQAIADSNVLVDVVERDGSSYKPLARYDSAVTGSDGVFQFLVRPIPRLHYRITAQVEGGPKKVKILTSEPSVRSENKGTIFPFPVKPEPVDLGAFILSDSIGGVSGVVVDKLGRPLKNITVSLESLEQPKQKMITDETGCFEFHELYPGKVDIVAMIFAQGTRMTVETGAPPLRIVLTLDEITPDMISPKSIGGGAVEVRPVDAMTNEPIVSDKTQLTVDQPHGNDIYLTADKDGVVRFCVGPGPHKIGCQIPNYNYHSENVVIENNKLHSVVLKIKPGKELAEKRQFGERQRPLEVSSSRPGSSEGSFQIVVQSRITRLPIAGAKIAVTGELDQSRYEAITGENGCANLAISASGYFLVESVSAQGYKTAGPKKSPFISTSGSQPMIIDLEQYPVFVKVRVLNEQNQPVPKVWVWYCFQVGKDTSSKNNAQTDQSGIAELEWLYESPDRPAQIDHVLQVQSDKSREGTMAIERVRSHPGQVLDIHVQKRVIPRVRILDGKGTPIAGMSFSVYLAPNNYQIFSCQNTTDAAGIFTGDPVPVGTEWFLRWDSKKGWETFTFLTAESPDGFQNLPDLIIEE